MEPAEPDAGLTAEAPRRVRVVGNSGAGTTTFARRRGRLLAVPHLELDAVFWGPDWQRRDLAAARDLLRALLDDATGGWVVDGNGNTRLEGLLDDADAVVWLDHPRRVVMPPVVRRTVVRGTVVRGATRRELWHGNRERLHTLLARDPQRNIVRWSWTQHAASRER